MTTYFQDYVNNSVSAMNSIRALEKDFDRACEAMVSTIRNDGTIFFAGNGGSASDAQHLAAELVGRFQVNRPAMRGLCLNTDTSILTALANDYGYDTVFSRQLEAQARPGDVAVLISTSGASPSILGAADTAKHLGVVTVALTGSADSPLAHRVDIALAVGSLATCHVQETHIAIGQALCGYVERSIHG